MKKNLTAKQHLIEAVGFVNKKYNTQIRRKEFAEYMEYNEFELALDSLLELAGEVDDRFKYGFWLHLERAASKMKLTNHEKLIQYKISDFWYDNAKKFKLKNPEIDATIYFLDKNEGGRSTIVYSGYRGTFYYDGQYNSVAQEFIGQATCEPGTTVRTLISFAAPETQIRKLYEGLKFKITEGDKVVGTGEIIKIMRKDLAKI